MITHVHTTSADVHELACTDTIHDALAAKTLVPAVHLVDTAHVDARQFAEATRRGIDLVGPYWDVTWRGYIGVPCRASRWVSKRGHVSGPPDLRANADCQGCQQPVGS